MDGTVSCYSSDMETGIIIAADGKRYVFAKAEWSHPDIRPDSGLLVTFEPAGSCARKIMMADRSLSPQV